MGTKYCKCGDTDDMHFFPEEDTVVNTEEMMCCGHNCTCKMFEEVKPKMVTRYTNDGIEKIELNQAILEELEVYKGMLNQALTVDKTDEHSSEFFRRWCINKEHNVIVRFIIEKEKAE